MKQRTVINQSIGIILVLGLVSLAACKQSGKETAGGGEVSTANKGQARYISTKSGLRMRATPGTKGKKVALVPGGDRVVIVAEQKTMQNIGGKSGVWTQISWAGKKGWVFGYYLTSKAPAAQPPAGGDPYGPYGGPGGDPYGPY